jgi:hypothetical protein
VTCTASLATPAGASSGIGEACAWQLAEAGCKLVLVARRAERLAALREALVGQYCVAVHVVTMDVRDLEAIKRLPDELPAEFQVGQGSAAPGAGCWEEAPAGLPVLVWPPVGLPPSQVLPVSASTLLCTFNPAPSTVHLPCPALPHRALPRRRLTFFWPMRGWHWGCHQYRSSTWRTSKR